MASRSPAPIIPATTVDLSKLHPNYLAQRSVRNPQRNFTQNHRQNYTDTPKETGGGDEDGGSDEEGEESKEVEVEVEEDIDEDVESDLLWASDPRKLRKLEELRGRFRSELEDPSAWTLQRIMSLTRSKRIFTAQEVVRHWMALVAELTKTPEEARLELPWVRRPEDLPFLKPLKWEELEARGFNFGQGVEGIYKRDARLTILFLFPEAETKGLSLGEKKRILTIASRIWVVNHLRAEGLLWVLRNEFHPYTREELGQVREWANTMSEDFMTYTALYPPPLLLGH